MEWIKFGWGTKFSPEFSPIENFRIDMSGITPTNKPLLEISDRVINNLVVEYPAPYNLFVSGGVDSQSMLWCWFNSQVSFSAYCVRFVDAQGKVYNDHDYETLVEFTNTYGIKINFIDFNVFLDICGFLNILVKKNPLKLINFPKLE
jgi:hypothetical protein